MPKDSKRLQVTRIETQVFGAVNAEQAWTPAINVYDCGGSVQVCAELAGVARESVRVSVEPGRLMIEGRRSVPEPMQQSAQCIRAMEIDHGLFRREVALPDDVVVSGVESAFEDGMLWVILPRSSK